MLHSFLMQFLRYYNILPLTAALSKPVRLGYKDLYTNGLLKLLINIIIIFIVKEVMVFKILGLEVPKNYP